MAVVVWPSPYDRIQSVNKKMTGATQVLSDDLVHFGENRHNTLPSGLDKLERLQAIQQELSRLAGLGRNVRSARLLG